MLAICKFATVAVHFWQPCYETSACSPSVANLGTFNLVAASGAAVISQSPGFGCFLLYLLTLGTTFFEAVRIFFHLHCVGKLTSSLLEYDSIAGFFWEEHNNMRAC